MPQAALPFYLTVQKVTRLSKNFVRVTLVGDDLASFGVNRPTHDLRIKIMLPGNGPLPDFRALMASDDWYLTWRELDPATRGFMRTYTVREHRKGENPEIDIDFVLHLDDSSGPASAWADAAQEGDSLVLIGPHRAVVGDQRWGIEWSGGESDRLLIVADETAVPAALAILQTLPAGAAGDALLEVPTSDDVLDVRAPEGVAVRWFPRDGRERGDDVLEAVRSLVQPSGKAGAVDDVDVDTDLLWEVPQDEHAGFYAFIAGEASVVKAARRYLVSECGIDRKSVSFMGYWREGRTEDT